MQTLIAILMQLMTISQMPALDLRIEAPSDCYNPRVGPMAYDATMTCTGGQVIRSECLKFEDIPAFVVGACPVGIGSR